MESLFAQPPTNLYGRAALYLCGNEMELEHFRALLDYQETKLRVQMAHGTLTVYGDGLQIAAMEKDRIRIRGLVLKTEFSYEEGKADEKR